ncbi:MAG: hypothetical protein OEL53_00555 [Rhodospirillales bacterium]|nr:hypothetical protein [Rhodospirillales bacterium]
MLKKAWNDPVWSKVIASAIIAILAIVISYFAGWGPAILSAISSVISAAVDFIASSSEVPNWLLLILGICAVTVVAFLAFLGWLHFLSEAYEDPLSKYREDNFFGILWRWRYFPSGEIYNLTSFCPRCDLQVYPNNASGWSAVDHIEYRCEDCGIRLNDFETTPDSVENRVIRQIQKKLRSMR